MAKGKKRKSSNLTTPKNSITRTRTPMSTNDMLQKLGQIDGGSKVSERVQSVIEKMTRPPETIIEHLRRAGVEFHTGPMKLDDGPAKVYVLIDYDEMVAKELESIKSGGFFKDEYPVKKTIKPDDLASFISPLITNEVINEKEETSGGSGDDRHQSESQTDAQERMRETNYPDS